MFANPEALSTSSTYSSTLALVSEALLLNAQPLTETWPEIVDPAAGVVALMRPKGGATPGTVQGGV